MVGMVLNNFKNDFIPNLKKIKDMNTFNTVWFVVYFLCIAPMIFFRHSGAAAFFPVYYSQAVPIVLVSLIGTGFSLGVTKTMMLVPMDGAERRRYVKNAYILKCLFCLIPMIAGAIVIALVYPGITPQALLAIVPFISFVLEYNMTPEFPRRRGYGSMSLQVFKVVVTAIIMIITAVDLAFVYEPIYIICIAVNTPLTVWFCIAYYPRMVRVYSEFEYSYTEKERTAKK